MSPANSLLSDAGRCLAEVEAPTENGSTQRQGGRRCFRIGVDGTSSLARFERLSGNWNLIGVNSRRHEAVGKGLLVCKTGAKCHEDE